MDIEFRFEMVKRIHLTPNLFTVENGLMTPTFKIKRFGLQLTSFTSLLIHVYRKDASKHYQKELSALYALGPVINEASML